MRAKGKSAADPLRCAVVGTLYADGLNPYADFDFAHDVAKRQLFEAPVSGGADSLVEVVDELTGGALAGRLRPNAKLSDGTEVDAPMVAEALARSPWYEPLLDVRARRDRLIFTAKGRSFDLRSFLSSDRVRFGVYRDGRWLGTGPYRVRRWGEDGIELEVNPHHPRRPAISSVQLRAYDPKHACPRILEDLDRDAVDLTAALSREELEGVDGVRKLFAAGTSTALLWLDTRSLSDTARRAIVRGIDRYTVLSTTYDNPMSSLASSLLPPRQGTTRMRLPFERGEAQRMIDAGARPPRPLKMVVVWGRRPYMPDPQKWAAEIARQLGTLGLEVTPCFTSSLEDYQHRLFEGDYDMVLGGWNAASPSPSEFADAMLHSSMTPKGPGSAGCNYAWVQSKQVDDALQVFRSMPSRDQEQALLRKVEEIAPVLPLAYGTTSIAARKDLEGLELADGAIFDLSRLRWRD